MGRRLAVLMVVCLGVASIALALAAVLDAPAIGLAAVVLVVAALLGREAWRWRGQRQGWMAVLVVLGVTALAGFVFERVRGGDPSIDCSMYRFGSTPWDRGRQQIDFERDTPAERYLRQAARDLVRCHLLVGLTDGQVRSRLGRPDRVADDAEPRLHKEFTYLVGYTPERGSGEDDELWMEIDRGRVVYATAPRRERGGPKGERSLEDGHPVGGGAPPVSG